MPTEIVSIGPPLALAQTTVYALPVKAVTILTTANVNISNNINMTPSFVVVATTGPVKIAGAFIQCTAATNCVVVLKAD